MISEIVCSRTLEGASVDPLLVFICAVNPYRERTREIQVVGLASKLDLHDPMRKLVYRVHLLPEAMLDYVFDYGSSAPTTEQLAAGVLTDEQRYVQSMLQRSFYPRLETMLVVASQNFIRDPANFGEDCSVSLRDVRRYKKLVQFFRKMREERSNADDEGEGDPGYYERFTAGFRAAFAPQRRDVRKYTRFDARVHGRREEEIAIVLALAMCYHSRLPTNEARYNYRRRIMQVWNQYRDHDHGVGAGYLTDGDFVTLLEHEQKDILERMLMDGHGDTRQLRKDWEGTAMNGALLENVFVLMVCILNRIPVFLVGKPGSSKSLSMKLIYRYLDELERTPLLPTHSGSISSHMLHVLSNLRGRDSNDLYFRVLPKMFELRYQGSENSTSEGIFQVFKRAERYANENQEAIATVLIDEVGLAEVSRHNPLKVLHGLIEPDSRKEFAVGLSTARNDQTDSNSFDLPYAVVGISNWALDPAKMNRAIVLSRPDPDADDLEKTAAAIMDSFAGHDEMTRRNRQRLLNPIAKTYCRYLAETAESTGSYATPLKSTPARHVFLCASLFPSTTGMVTFTDCATSTLSSRWWAANQQSLRRTSPTVSCATLAGH